MWMQEIYRRGTTKKYIVPCLDVFSRYKYINRGTCPIKNGNLQTVVLARIIKVWIHVNTQCESKNPKSVKIFYKFSFDTCQPHIFYLKCWTKYYPWIVSKLKLISIQKKISNLKYEKKNIFTSIIIINC